MPGTLFVVATPIGNLEDITARALRTLREVALIAAEDTRHTRHLLTHFGISTPSTSLHEHNERAKLPQLVDRLLRGDSIALVSDAGTPVVSDPGSRFIEAAIEAGVRVEPIPGVSAVITAIMASGIDMDSFVWAGFAPTRSKDIDRWLSGLVSSGRPVVFFEAPHRLLATLERILTSAGDIKVSIGREMTKFHEVFLRGRLSEVIPRVSEPRGEFTVVADFRSINTALAVPAGPSPQDLANEIGLLTEISGLRGRSAVAAVAKKFGLATNVAYAMLRDAKRRDE